MRSICSIITLMLILTTCASAIAGDAAAWPQWRGQQRTGKIDAAPWPDKLTDDHLQLVWRVELGNSYSGPIVTADRVFVTETRDATTEHVQALARGTGKSLWQASWAGSISVPFFAKANGDWIRSTPAVDEDSIYVAGIRDVVVRLDTATGKERWRTDLMEKFSTPVPAFGFVASPLVVGDHVFVQAGGGFIKLDKKTGEVVWRTLEDSGGMYGSILIAFPGNPQRCPTDFGANSTEAGGGGCGLGQSVLVPTRQSRPGNEHSDANCHRQSSFHEFVRRWINPV